MHTLLLLLLLFTDQTTQPTKQPVDEDVEVLSAYLTGHFSSAAQAEGDPSYFDVHLRAVPIWGDRGDGPWLYVEQAIASALDRPYRQRVYKLSVDGDQFRSDVYTLPGDPLQFAGAWREPGRFDDLPAEALTLRAGCGIVMRFDGDAFVGGTVGRGCESSRAGAAYVTSEVRLTPTQVISWDRGFSDDGTQVWGAEKGGYVFDRITD